MQNNTLKIGMLGFGAMGKAHAYAVTNLPYFYGALPFSAVIAGVCTSSPDRARAAVTPYGLTAVAHEDELIANPDIDIIDICTPNRLQYASICKALETGKHILCEKPLGISAEEGAELAAMAQASGKVCRVVFNNRFIPAVMRAKQLIDEGAIGDVLSFHAAYLHNSCLDPNKAAGWKQSGEYGAGVLRDLGSHIIDLIYYLCGDFDSVYARKQIAFPERFGVYRK